MSLDWIKHLYGFSSGIYFSVVVVLVFYGLSYRKAYNWRITAAFLLVALSFSSYGFYNIFFQQLFTDATKSLYSKNFLKFCAMVTPTSVLILTYIYIRGYTLRSARAYQRYKKEIWLVYLIYISTIANIIAIYFVDDNKTIALMLLLGFVLPCFGAARLAMVSNEKDVSTIGHIAQFSGLLIFILTIGLYSIENTQLTSPAIQALTNVGFGLSTLLAGLFSVRYGYEEVWSFFVLQDMDKRNLLNHVTTGINNNQFSLNYQPQLNLQTGKITAAEVLIRWQHPKKGNIPPTDYIPLAEETDLISHITMWVISTAIKQAKQLQEIGHALKISINFSPKDISPHVIDHLERMLIKYDYPSELIVVEITESQVINSSDKTFVASMERLHTLGVSISIDDYGTGFSSLSHLQKLHVHELKIDQSFIKELDYDTDSYAIVYSTLQMARNLNLITVAEGIEKEETLNILKELKCNFAQGYGIAKPMPFDALLEWLNDNQFKAK